MGQIGVPHLPLDSLFSKSSWTLGTFMWPSNSFIIIFTTVLESNCNIKFENNMIIKVMVIYSLKNTINISKNYDKLVSRFCYTFSQIKTFIRPASVGFFFFFIFLCVNLSSVFLHVNCNIRTSFLTGLFHLYFSPKLVIV
jgi:hypothetical protein